MKLILEIELDDDYIFEDLSLDYKLNYGEHGVIEMVNNAKLFKLEEVNINEQTNKILQ